MSGDGGFRQDMPPPGGYKTFHYARTYMKSGAKPYIILPFAGFCTVYGYFQAKMQIKQRLTEKFEDNDLKCAMEPFILAERDRMWLKLCKRNRDIERELMKNVPGWQVGTWYGEPVFFTIDDDHWWDPSPEEVFAHSPRRTWFRELNWDQHSEYSAPKFYDKYIPEFLKHYIR